jgi:hypothetical protein
MTAMTKSSILVSRVALRCIRRDSWQGMYDYILTEVVRER